MNLIWTAQIDRINDGNVVEILPHFILYFAFEKSENYHLNGFLVHWVGVLFKWIRTHSPGFCLSGIWKGKVLWVGSVRHGNYFWNSFRRYRTGPVWKLSTEPVRQKLSDPPIEGPVFKISTEPFLAKVIHICLNRPFITRKLARFTSW